MVCAGYVVKGLTIMDKNEIVYNDPLTEKERKQTLRQARNAIKIKKIKSLAKGLFKKV